MSGEKYVQVTERDHSRMMNACKQVDQQRAINSRLQSELADAEREIQRRNKEAQSRFAHYESSISSMSAEMRSMDQAHTQQIREQRQRFDSELSNLGRRMSAQRMEYLDLLEKQQTHLRSEMEQHRQALQGQITQLAADIARKEADQSRQANQWLQDTQALLDGIDAGYQHMAFLPGELEKIKSELYLAEENHNKGMHQAAVATAQQTMLRGMELRLRLERLEAEWRLHHAAALTSCRETLAYCDTLTSLKLAIEGRELDAEIDYWTEGGLATLLGKVRQQIERLESAEPKAMPLTSLKEAIQNSTTWRSQAEALIEKTRESVVCSQRRHDIVGQLADKIEGQGWRVSDSAYEGEKVDIVGGQERGWRNAYHSKFKHLNGDELILIVEPDQSTEKFGNRVTLSTFSKSNNVNMNHALAESVRSEMAKMGLIVRAPQARPGYENRAQGDQARLDFEKVRKTKSVTKVG